MSFLSIQFALLFILFLFLVWLWKNPTWHKVLLLAASCAFYAFWDWRFLGLLFIITLADYFISVRLQRSTNRNVRKSLLFVNLALNLSILGYFKYTNFFIETLNLVSGRLGLAIPEMSIILPVGISFYVFESISYIVDVYRGVTRPADSLLDYAVFITFFPRLVAGPIMRAAHFLPQLSRGLRISPDQALQGAQLFVQGAIKKAVVADAMALLVDAVYASPGIYSSATVYLGIAAYSVQILFDFSGYSDMACGIARLLGFELPLNFNLPYVAQSITEFWKRWHISLSSWLRDYLYIPLGGNRRGGFRTYANLLLTMLLGGLWHGASWNFVFWGGLHGSMLALERFFTARSASIPADQKPAAQWARAVPVFAIVTLVWVFFRSPSVETTRLVFEKLLFLQPDGITWLYLPALIFVPIVFLGGLVARNQKWDLSRLTVAKPYAIPLVLAEFLFAFLFAAGAQSPFIYFQF
ncbi:MAG: MBOAT family protein [Chloroflexi bacterium]|nr:MBOAT family protein [Chloroflexota bacterium]